MFIAHHLDGRLGGFLDAFDASSNHLQRHFKKNNNSKATLWAKKPPIKKMRSWQHEKLNKLLLMFINHKPSGKPAIQLPIKTVLLSYVFQVCFKIFKFQLCSM